MGMKKAPPKQSAAARRAQEAKYTKKANKNAVKVTGKQSTSGRKAQEKKFRIKATQDKFRRLLKQKGSGSKNTKPKKKLSGVDAYKGKPKTSGPKNKWGKKPRKIDPRRSTWLVDGKRGGPPKKSKPNPNMLRGRTVKRGRRLRRKPQRSIARTMRTNRRNLNRAGSGSRQIKRSVGRTMSLNRRNLRGRLGRSGRRFRR